MPQAGAATRARQEFERAALLFAAGAGEIGSGVSFLAENPEIMTKIVKFALCSAIGQSFIFSCAITAARFRRRNSMSYACPAITW